MEHIAHIKSATGKLTIFHCWKCGKSWEVFFWDKRKKESQDLTWCPWCGTVGLDNDVAK